MVDDNAHVRNAVCRFLRQQGCAVQAATNGAEGLERIARASFDAIVSDIQMPVVDGADFWRRAIALHPGLRGRFLFCSGLPLPDSIAREPSIRFVSKPFAPDELWTALNDVLTARLPSTLRAAGRRVR